MNNTELYIIQAGNFRLDGGACFGAVPKSIWSRLVEPDQNNMLPISCRCLLVRDGHRLVLIDDGIGDKQDEKYLQFFYLFGDDSLGGALAKHGISPEDITDVIQTHLHFDHCGGGVKYNNERTAFILTFPHATYWCSRTQWDWAVNPNVREGASYLPENFMPVMESGRFKFIEVEGKFSDHISFKIFNGHTDGQLVPHIRHKGRTVVYMGDFIPTAYHIPLAYVPAYDTRPLLTMEEKAEFLKTALENDYILFFEHDHDNEACTLISTGKGIRAGRTGSLLEMLSQA